MTTRAMAPPSPKYKPNQKVYASENGNTYEAVIRKSTLRSKKQMHDHEENKNPGFHCFWEHYVHFHGWSNNHDRWVTEGDLSSMDNEKSRFAAELSKQRALESERERRQKKIRIEKERRDKAAAKKRKLEDPTDASVSTVEYLKQCCQLPFTLKTVLIDDRERITRLGRLVANGYDDPSTIINHNSKTAWSPPRAMHILPAKVTVAKILDIFVRTRNKTTSEPDAAQNASEETDVNRNDGMTSSPHTYTEFAEDMKLLFNSMLPKMLLYTQERNQYLSLARATRSEITNQPPSNIKNKQRKRKELSKDSKTTKNGTNHELKNVVNKLQKQRMPLYDNMSQIYCGEFLLRMLFRLPTLFSILDSSVTTFLNSEDEADIQASNISSKVIPSPNFLLLSILSVWKSSKTKSSQMEGSNLCQLIRELIVFLQENKTSCFKGKYRKPMFEEYMESEIKISEKFAKGML
mmetsp:Transcript_19310/g.27164  ORF Transcript_19310/g.27164 Transcript_19310/m.27164 type:complete len:463 (+) Transcript_19310:103-1491(+)